MKNLLIIVSVVAVLHPSFSVVCAAAPSPVAQTGQITCYSSYGSVISCAGTGQDGDLKRGVEWPKPRFIDNGNSTVTDNLTGLMWTKDANLPLAGKTWQLALDYVAAMNAGTYANFGYTDWRLPSIRELQSLVDASRSYPSFPAVHPFTSVQSSGYWSSTTIAANISYAWCVSMTGGSEESYGKTSYLLYVWPVRLGQ